MPEIKNNDRKSLDERMIMTDIERLRHSCAHVMATAILRLWPNAQLAGGPPVENGFYYDIDLEHRISTEDFAKIEVEMRKIIKANQVFEKEIITRSEAEKLIKSGRLGALFERKEPSKYKAILLKDIPKGEEISTYRNGDFVDLCAGPHVARTGNCKAFKILSVASAYFKGDAKNEQLQRIYGTAFKNQTALAEYLEQLEEAKKRDHRKLGKERNLFHIDDTVGQGLILWKPAGAIVRRELQNFILENLDAQNYQQVFTPHIGKLELYKTSGHFPYYYDSQYPPIIHSESLAKFAEEDATCGHLANCMQQGEIDGYLLKPMNCPHHIKIFQSEHHSYRDLPIRLAEFGTVYRWEKSGELNGMTRARGFTQDDAHIFCTEEQLEKEIILCLELVEVVLAKVQLENYQVRISLRGDDAEKYVGSSENWDKAENALRQAVANINAPVEEAKGEAAFYGPKIDFIVKDSIGRDWQLGTVQVDYNLPRRFGLNYIGADNKSHFPVMIHRAPFGSLERFFAILTEHLAGKFPVWLAPEQVRILTVSEKSNDYAGEIFSRLKQLGVRAVLENSAEKIGAKIRSAQLEQVPYMLIIGEKEIEKKEISLRHREQGVLPSMPAEEFYQKIKTEITERIELHCKQ